MRVKVAVSAATDPVRDRRSNFRKYAFSVVRVQKSRRRFWPTAVCSSE